MNESSWHSFSTDVCVHRRFNAQQRQPRPDSEHSAEQEASDSEEGGSGRAPTDREELFKGARAAGPSGRPRARTAAEIKTAYGRNVAPRCDGGVRSCILLLGYLR